MAFDGNLWTSQLVLIYMKYQKNPICLTKYSILDSFSLTLTFICFVIADKLTTVANAVILEFVFPIFILIMNALVFHQKICYTDALVIGISMCGITLFFFDQIVSGTFLGIF